MTSTSTLPPSPFPTQDNTVAYKVPPQPALWNHSMGVCDSFFKYLLFMASNGTIPYHPSLLNHDMNFVRTTYANLLSLKQTNGSVSFEPRNTTEKAAKTMERITFTTVS